jgi:2-polyprenyl-3-methyl-5-hydroxy-6-metoxy-1,4-benzoquinol methylase
MKMSANKNSQMYEYAYFNSQPIHHHAYLISPLLELLEQARSSLKIDRVRVLDLGCGNGSLTQEIARHGYEIIGVEESLSGIEAARQQNSLASCQFLQGSIYNLPYDRLGEPFDVVIAAEAIEHLLYPRELIRSARKCLKPSGRLIVTTPYHGYWKNLALAISGKMDVHFTALWDGGHIKFFSVKTLSTLLEQEGFINTQFKFAGRYPYLWKSMLCCSTPVPDRSSNES